MEISGDFIYIICFFLLLTSFYFVDDGGILYIVLNSFGYLVYFAFLFVSIGNTYKPSKGFVLYKSFLGLGPKISVI